jgi:hypothetical protein
MQQAGMQVQPAQESSLESTKGGGFFEVVSYLAGNIQENKEFLLALFTGANGAIKLLYERHKQNSKTTAKPEVELDGGTVEIEESDLDDPQRLPSRFAERHPQIAEKVTSSSKLRLKERLRSKRRS